ncbi:MAG: LON peptidase substrate-binding domain-containing protein [Microbacteriaceae bacterium]
MTVEIPMFPLGSVLFPHMPMQLRVFEERYLVMLSEILAEEPSVFGTVLIERGQEVGGGEMRFTIGTVATILQLEGADGFVALVAEGGERFEITEWLDDAPYPRADVRELPDLEWDDDIEPLRDRAEKVVRRAVAIASEFGDQQWAADVALSDDPLESAWQLAGIAPLAEIDQLALLRSESVTQLLERTIEFTEAATLAFEAMLESGPDDAEL